MNDESSSSIKLDRALSIIKRRAPIVLICVLIAGGSAYAFARHQAKQYTATASLLFSPSQPGLAGAGLTSSQQPPNQSQQDTNVQLVGLGGTAAKTAIQLGPNWTPGMVKGAIGISANSDTSIVNVAATASSPALAQTIANTYANTFVTEQQQNTLAQITTAQRLLNAEFNGLAPAEKLGAQGVALADRIQTLGLLAKLATANVTIAGLAGKPSSPSAPKVSRNAALGAILGLLIGLGVAFLLERFDRRIRDPEEFAAIYGVPVLATVPERKEYGTIMSRLASSRESGARFSRYDEVFNLLRSYLRYLAVDNDIRTLLVVSADPGDGKTTVSFNLAKAAAALGSRVLLIEADLRRGTLVDPMPAQTRAGLPDVLTGTASMQQAVHSFEVGPTGVLDVLVAGAFPPPNPGQLLDSRAMQSLLEQVRSTYDMVIIDTPPLGLVADAIPLLTKVDGVIVVGRLNKSGRTAAEQLRQKLNSVGAPTLGVVANGARGAEAPGYYDRRHRYYESSEPMPIVSRNGAAHANGSANGSAPAAGVSTIDDVH